MHNSPAVTFRPMTAADAQAALPLILSSGPEAFAYVFATGGKTASDFLRHTLAQTGGEFGTGNHVVGIMDGRVVAAGGGWSGARNLAFMLAAPGQFLRVFGPRAVPGIIMRGLQAESIMHPPKPHEWYVGHLGVDPALRGRGIGEAMIAHLLAAAPPTVKTAVLDVSAENPRAEALYTRLGFRVTAEHISHYRRGAGYIPTHRRMERPL